ncbi:MAG: 16S rRNA (cytidine(1402)-2'-O)-methyltransferase [Thermodesulfobacteriaceae bacterium]|nr:16S rRNA (cytidine(1402)-2'-O)-methyltransferase [Thermodesulfobacteriaceae bacterium]MDW8135872.1 16S rRNA (cytidine(1402)-2'-O)-methyltransferase [Thermodesulfobacterium sp.]
MSCLFVVGLPIGNLKDITLRALEVLKRVRYVVCEDTRSFKKLINYYQLGEKNLISFYKNIEKKRIPKILELLKKGEEVALVSEAGTPLLSDPGALLVKEVYQNRIKIVPVPGVSALTCALSVSGIFLEKGFLFLGFLPRKKLEKIKLLSKVPIDLPLVIFEAPHRFKKTLKELLEILGNRKCFLARELTKIYEELTWSDFKSLLEREEFLGEITLIIMPEENSFLKTDLINIKDGELLEVIKKEFELLKNQGFKLKERIKLLAQKYGLSSKELYQLFS